MARQNIAIFKKCKYMFIKNYTLVNKKYMLIKSK